MDSSRAGMTPSDLNPMSRRTSSLSTLTTVPFTMSPSSNSTIVPAIASSNERPSRSSATTCLGVYSPGSSSAVSAASSPWVASVVACSSAWSDIRGVAFFPDSPRPRLVCVRERVTRATRSPTGDRTTRPFRDEEVLGLFEVGRGGSICTRCHRPHVLDAQADRGGEQAQLTRCVARGAWTAAS